MAYTYICCLNILKIIKRRNYFPEVKFVFLNVILTLNQYAVQSKKYSMGIGMEELSRYEFTFF